MPDPLTTAGIAAATSILVAVITTLGTQYGTARRDRRAEESAQKVRSEDQRAVLDAVIARYRDPLLTAGFDLQSRLFNMCRQGFMWAYYANGRPSQRTYAELHTLFVFAEYLGWVEIMRKEIQFLDLQEIGEARRVNGLLAAVTDALASDAVPLGEDFMLFRGEQRAIGEVVTTRREDDDKNTRQQECIGYAEFTRRIKDPEFAAWFGDFTEQLRRVGEETQVHSPRLIILQHALVDLIEALDPDQKRFDRRQLTRM